MFQKFLGLITNNTFAKNSFILFAGSMLVNVLNYVFHLVVGRMVDKTVYGEIESLTSLLTIVSVPTATLSMVAMKFSAQHKAEDNLKEAFSFWKYLNKKVLLLGAPFFIVVLLMTPFVADFLKIDSVWAVTLIWVMMILSFFSSINTGILSGWQKFRQSSLASLFGALIKLGAGILLVKLGFALNGTIGSFTIGMLVSYIASVAYLKFIRKNKVSVSEGQNNIIDSKSFKKYFLPVLLGNVAITILGNIDMVIAKHNLDDSWAGDYGALTIVSKIIFFATGAIATVLFSMSAENHHKKENSFKVFAQAFAFMAIITFFATIVYFLFPHLILNLLFGSRYNDAAPYLGWFGILVSLYSLSNLILSYLLSIHETKFIYGFLVVSLLLIIGLTFWGNSIYAILWIAILAQVCAILVGGICIFEHKKSLELKLAVK